MARQAVGEDRAGTSSSTAATAAGVEGGPAAGNDAAGETGLEFMDATDAQTPQAGVQYSTDLRKELSQDVLASLDGPSPRDAEPAEDAMMDLGSVRADMQLISDLSSLSLPVDHGASPASANLCVDLGGGSDDGGDGLHRSTSLSESPVFGSAMPREAFSVGYSSVPVSAPTTCDFPPSGPPADLSAEPLQTSASFANSIPAVETAFFADEVSAKFSASPPAIPAGVASTIDSPSGHGFRSSDAGADLASSRASQERWEGAEVDAPSFDSVTQETARKQEALEVSCHSGDGLPASPVPRDVASVDVPEPSEHAVSGVAGAAGNVGPLPVDESSHPQRSSPSPASAVTLLFPVHGEPVPESSSVNAEVPAIEMQRPASGGNGPVGVFEASRDTQLVMSGLLSPTPDTLPSDSPRGAVEGSPSARESVPVILEGAPPSTGPSFVSPKMSNSPFSSVSVSPLTADVSMSRVALDNASVLRNNHILDTSRAFLNNPLSQNCTAAAVEPRLHYTLQGPFPASSATPSMFTSDPASSLHVVRSGDGPVSQLPVIPLSVYFDGSGSPFRGRKSARKKKSAESETDLEETKGKAVSDVEQSEEVAELERMLEAQKRMVQWQIDEIQRIAALQTQLTGTNPLSEEVAWHVLGVRAGGNVTGDSISPEALRSLQEIFAIKDTLTKKEVRDISCTTGASLTQVREYFTSRRSLVRKLVQQAHDEAGRLGIKNTSEQSQQMADFNSISEIEIDLGFDKLSGVETVERLLEAMRAEKAFAGRTQVLQVVLRTDAASPSLRRLLEKGGLKILGGWLVESVAEEQITLVSNMLKVLSHLPLSSAYSHQMSPLIQSVNKLRFHHVSAVANQALSVFTKWCKLFSPNSEKAKSAKSLASESSTGTQSPAGGPKRSRDSAAVVPAPGLRKKKARAVNGVEASQLDKASPTATPKSPSLNGTTQGASETPSTAQPPSSTPPTQSPATKPRWSSTLQPSESAVAAVSVSRKRLGSQSLVDHSKDRRRLLPVDGIPVGKTVGSKPATISKNSRPLSTDDIYKAKKLERLMQEPIGKSKKRLRETSESQNAIQQPGTPNKTLSPSAQDQAGAVKQGSMSTSSPGQGSQIGGAVISTLGREDDVTLQEAQSPEHSEVTVTPVGAVPITGELSKGVADGSTFDLVRSDGVGNSVYAPQEQRLMVPERDPSEGVEDTSVPSISSSAFQEKAQEPSNLSISQQSTNVISKSAVDVMEIKDDISLEKVRETGINATPSPHEAKLSAFYATLRASMVRWRIPPEFQVDDQWGVAVGEESKEKEFQSVRVKREEEAYYPELAAIPENPKDPWEEEPNYDDSLTLEIFVENEQPKASFGAAEQSDVHKPSAVPPVQYDVEPSLQPDVLNNTKQTATTVHAQQPPAMFPNKMPDSNGLNLVVQQLSAGGGGGVHDPDLLALLLRNPELVSQLTSAQASYPLPGNANPGVFGQPSNPLKPMNSFGNNGPGLGLLAGDLGQEKGISSNNSKALGIPLQPGRSVSSVDQMPPESMQAQDSVTMMPPGMGQQQTSGFVPHGGVDNRFLSPQHPSVVARSAQNSSVWEQLRVSAPPRSPPSLPPPPPLPSMQTVTNQALQPSMASQQNKQSNHWPESQATAWVGGGLSPLSATQTHHPVQEQLRIRPQTIISHNNRLPSFGGIAALPPVEGGSVTPLPQTEVHNQRPWPNGNRILPALENPSAIHASVHDNAGRMQVPVHDQSGRLHLTVRDNISRMQTPLQEDVSRLQENASRMHTQAHENASRIHTPTRETASRMQENASRMHAPTHETASRMQENASRMHSSTHDNASRMHENATRIHTQMHDGASRMQDSASRVYSPMQENPSRVYSPMHESASRILENANRIHTPIHESASRILENANRIHTPIHESASRIHENAGRILTPLHESAGRINENPSRIHTPMHDSASRMHENAGRILTPLHEGASRMHENASRIHSPVPENASRIHTALRENASRMHAASQEATVRNDRWLRPNLNMRSGGGRELTDLGVRNVGGQVGREFSDLGDGGSRHANVVDNRSMWVANDRARSAGAQLPGRYGPPQASPFPATPLWQVQQDRSNSRPVQGAAASFPLRRDVRPPQQQLWHSNVGPASRQVWRGPQ